MVGPVHINDGINKVTSSVAYGAPRGFCTDYIHGTPLPMQGGWHGIPISMMRIMKVKGVKCPFQGHDTIKWQKLDVTQVS